MHPPSKPRLWATAMPGDWTGRSLRSDICWDNIMTRRADRRSSKSCLSTRRATNVSQMRKWRTTKRTQTHMCGLSAKTSGYRVTVLSTARNAALATLTRGTAESAESAKLAVILRVTVVEDGHALAHSMVKRARKHLMPRLLNEGCHWWVPRRELEKRAWILGTTQSAK